METIKNWTWFTSRKVKRVFFAVLQNVMVHTHYKWHTISVYKIDGKVELELNGLPLSKMPENSHFVFVAKLPNNTLNELEKNVSWDSIKERSVNNAKKFETPNEPS